MQYPLAENGYKNEFKKLKFKWIKTNKKKGAKITKIKLSDTENKKNTKAKWFLNNPNTT